MLSLTSRKFFKFAINSGIMIWLNLTWEFKTKKMASLQHGNMNPKKSLSRKGKKRLRINLRRNNKIEKKKRRKSIRYFFCYFRWREIQTIYGEMILNSLNSMKEEFRPMKRRRKKELMFLKPSQKNSERHFKKNGMLKMSFTKNG